MSKSKPATPGADAPYGTEPRRRKGPLIVLLVLFLLWAAFLLWMALVYPAR